MNSNKRKINETDDQVIPGTPQEKHKKKPRKRSNKCSDSDNVVPVRILSTENLVVKNPIASDDDQRQSIENLLDDIDFTDDFTVENVQVNSFELVQTKQTN